MRRATSTVVALACMFITTTTYAQAQSTPKTPHRVVEYVNTVNPADPVRMTGSGIIIAGRTGAVRAMSRFAGPAAGAQPLADCGNYYKNELGNAVNVYVAAIPLAVAYYAPTAAKSMTKNQGAAVNAMFAALNDNVKGVDVYSALAQHVKEPIYFRTDHHWAPLAGYYAAKEFARVAGVPFRDLSHYEEVVQERYIGSMYQFSGNDKAVLSSPDRFVYHKPKGVEYTTTYIQYNIDSNKRIVSESKPFVGKYFYNLSGSSAYCIFMGGDSKITQVRTSTKNGRRLVIVKDSFGNVLPGYLFYSFEEIHVIDFRYFNKNMKRYIKDNGITDVLLASNISFACTQSTMNKYKRFIVQ